MVELRPVIKKIVPKSRIHLRRLQPQKFKLVFCSEFHPINWFHIFMGSLKLVTILFFHGRVQNIHFTVSDSDQQREKLYSAFFAVLLRYKPQVVSYHIL